MPEVNLKGKTLLLSSILLLFVSAYWMDSFGLARNGLINGFGGGQSQIFTKVKTGLIHWIVGPPCRKAETTEVDMGNGTHKLVVFRNGNKREYLIRNEVWSEYLDIGGAESVVGSPTSNEYTWCGGRRQDFERGHWLYWSEKTGVVMDYTPYIKRTSSSDTALQPPIFCQGKPMVEWEDWSSEKYYITQDFGVNGHLGQDLALNGDPNPGYEIRPVADGKVVFAGWTGPQAWGYMVLIQHSLENGRHFYSQYSHLYDLPTVFPGQKVNGDTILGWVGTTGKSTGPHLDLQIKELPERSKDADEIFSLEDIGRGYVENRTPFNGNVSIDYQTGIVYYKPSYFISCFNHGSVLLGQMPKRQES